MSQAINHPHIIRRKDIGHGAPIIEGMWTHDKNIVGYYKPGYTSDGLAEGFPYLTCSNI
jgi:uncharacterized protein (DUF433 family)